MPETPHPAPKPGTKPPGAKGPMGIPTWGWILGAVAGLVIGLIVYKKSSTSSAASTSGGTGQDQSASPSGTDSGNSGGGAVASPPPDNFAAQLAALGLGSNGASGSQTASTTTDSGTTGGTASPNYSVDTSGTPSSPGDIQSTPFTSYSIPGPTPASTPTPIKVSSGHGPQLTG